MTRDKQAKLAHILELSRKHTALLGELQRSMRLQEFYPAAFEHGACRSCVIGAPSSGFRFRVTRGDDSQQEWPLEDVPFDVWRPAATFLDDPRWCYHRSFLHKYAPQEYERLYGYNRQRTQQEGNP